MAEEMERNGMIRGLGQERRALIHPSFNLLSSLHLEQDTTCPYLWTPIPITLQLEGGIFLLKENTSFPASHLLSSAM